jgi:hypothetical protein
LPTIEHAEKGSTQKYGPRHSQLSAAHWIDGATHRYSVVQAWKAAHQPAQSSQLASGVQVRIGTHEPQQVPTTEGTSPGSQTGGIASQSTGVGLQETAPLPPPPISPPP